MFLEIALFKKAYLAFYNDDIKELLEEYFFENSNNWSNQGIYKLKGVKAWYEYNKYLGYKDLHKQFENERSGYSCLKGATHSWAKGAIIPE